MPQYRKLHVKAVQSQDINDMPDDFTRLLWVMLPLGLDGEGRGIDNPAWVRSRVMPIREDVTLEQVRQAMNWYANHGMIERYTAAGRCYFWIPTWPKYQGDTSKEAASELPEPPVQTNSVPTPELVQSKSASDSDAYTDTDTDASACLPAAVAAAPTPLPKPKKPKAEIPPAVEVFRRNTNRYPKQAVWPMIDTAVGRDPPDLERWQNVILRWLSMGWSPVNVNGMLDFYSHGELPGADRGNGRRPRQPLAAADHISPEMRAFAQRSQRKIAEYLAADANAARAGPDPPA